MAKFPITLTGSRLGWISILCWGLAPNSASAWVKHESLMPAILQNLRPSTAEKLKRPFQTFCPADDQTFFARLVPELDLNPSAKLPPTSERQCLAHQSISGFFILNNQFVDDPDLGIDQNLPESSDPKGDRKWMGGKTGIGSQGFRHQYFGGWQITKPVATFQIPPHTLGLAPDRIQLIASLARKTIREGNLVWGYRLLAWSLHYIQDLSQPFHTTQIISTQMVPWTSLAAWPPSQGFDHLVKATTHSIFNYHWAIEGYTLWQLTNNQKNPNFTECLATPDTKSNLLARLPTDHGNDYPFAVAHAMADASIEIAERLGKAEIAFFGKKLKTPEVSLPENRGNPDYAELTKNPELAATRKDLLEVSCIALANASVGSRALMDWALEP